MQVIFPSNIVLVNVIIKATASSPLSTTSPTSTNAKNINENQKEFLYSSVEITPLFFMIETYRRIYYQDWIHPYCSTRSSCKHCSYSLFGSNDDELGRKRFWDEFILIYQWITKWMIISSSIIFRNVLKTSQCSGTLVRTISLDCLETCFQVLHPYKKCTLCILQC